MWGPQTGRPSLLTQLPVSGEGTKPSSPWDGRRPRNEASEQEKPASQGTHWFHCRTLKSPEALALDLARILL